MRPKKRNKNPSRTLARHHGRALAFLVLVLLVLGLTTAAVELGDAGGAPTSDKLEHAVLERVVDGDTIVVIVNGATERVRLIGIDAAESVSPDASLNTEEGARASEHLKAELAKGQDLWLERDVSDRDKYGRLLRYVWLAWSDDPENEQEARAKMLNARLVAEGWAEPKTYKPDVSRAGLFARIAEERSS